MPMAQYFGRKKSDGDNLQSNQVIIGLRIPHLVNVEVGATPSNVVLE